MHATEFKFLGLLVAVGIALPVCAQQAQDAAPAPAAVASSPPTAAPEQKPDTTMLKGNVQTVQELIRAESEIALAKARKEKVAAGLEEAVPAAMKKKAPARLDVNVESIAGVPGNLRAYLTANGQRYENVRIGAKVQSCEIEAIQNKCVVLKPAAKGVKAEQCPVSCWTGTSPPMFASGGFLSGGAAGIPPGGPLPIPSEGLPPGSVAPPGTPGFLPAVQPPPSQAIAVPSLAR